MNLIKICFYYQLQSMNSLAMNGNESAQQEKLKSSNFSPKMFKIGKFGSYAKKL